MSRIWSSCGGSYVCGHCKKPIAFNDPMLTITPHPSRNWTVDFKRCRACAANDGDVPPADLPPARVNAGVAIEPRLLERGGQKGLPLDFKLAAAGREPGSDD